MKESCLSQNPLVRGGVSQQQRLLKTLLPTYVGVDERNMKDLAFLVKTLAGEIQYHEYDEVTKAVFKDNWESFFDITTEDWEEFSLEEFLDNLKLNQEAKPHLALFFSFLYLFRVAQDDMNTITKRHLDFYYREVLQLEEKPAMPDQVAVIFKLAKNVSGHLIKKGTTLKGGKDDTGVESIYEVEKDIVVNKARVSELKSVFANINDSFLGLSPYPENDHRIYVSPIANSADGQGASIETDEGSWKTFGQPYFPLLGTGLPDEKAADRPQSEIGFILASPILFMAEGNRKITLTFTFPTNKGISLDHDHFVVKLSGEKDWVIPESNIEDVTEFSGNKLTITRTISETQPAIVTYDPENLIQPIGTRWPVIAILLNTEKPGNPFIYKALKNIKPVNADISIIVKGVRNLVLQNDQSMLDPSKPFLPFSNRPYIGSNFYVGSWEVFQKKLKRLQFNFKWNDLPEDENGFQDYYVNYIGSKNREKRKNNEFKIEISVLDQKNWVTVKEKQNLFTDSEGKDVGDKDKLPDVNADNSIITLKNNSILSGIGRNAELKQSEVFDLNVQKGFLKISLKNQDFGHAIFPNSYAKRAIKMANDPSKGPLPNPPYTPSMQNFSLNYNSSVSYDLGLVSKSAYENRVEQFFYQDAFGVKEVDLTQSKNSLLPRFSAEGNLYIGIKDFIPPQSLSILFQVAEGSANPDKARQEVLWYYLAENEWMRFEDSSILSDTTNGLLTSGIISFAIPKNASKENTLLPAGSYWLKMAVKEDSDAISKLIDIQTQAVLAKFQDNDNDPDHLRLSLAAESISKLVTPNSAVDKVIQPYASFGGSVKEESNDYYTRVSERLRHKQRAITIWDYEHLTLQAFPSVYKVKCINHTRFEGTFENYSEMAPGNVTLIVVSNVQNKNAVDPLRPKTSLSVLDEIHAHIEAINPVCLDLHVRNPVYEEVKTQFKVKFSVADTGFYQSKLEEEIKEFLSPWSSECAADIQFGGKIHKSVILNFVEERSYVDYVTCFEMFHIVPLNLENNSGKDVDEAIATTAVSILGSADSHEVIPIPFESEVCGCKDNTTRSTMEIVSIQECPCQDKPGSVQVSRKIVNNDIDLI